jgi:hypothetical protein
MEAIAAASSFTLIFVAGVAGRIAVLAGMDEKTAGVLTKGVILLLFFVFGFACVGLLLHVFIVLQVRMGNGGASMIRFLAEHETGVTLAFWAFLGLGTLVALPFALRDIAGVNLQMPLAGSKGVLVADIGMTLEEIRRSSTFQIRAPRDMGEYMLGSEEAVFEFRIRSAGFSFPQSRYYFFETGKNRDPRIAALNVGITPRKLPKPELEAFRHRVQGQFRADGWMPAHYVAQSEETMRLWGGSRTTGDGRYWGKGDTVVTIETNRMDEEKRDEPPGSGQFILYLDLRPRSSDPRLVFEPSAWTN